MTPAIASPPTRPSPNGVVGYLSWKRFIAGGSEGVKEAVVLEGGHGAKLVWADGHESEFSLQWLRDHSDGSFHPSTMQRKVDTFSISNEPRVTHASVEPMSSTAKHANKDIDERSQQVLRLRWDAVGNEPGGEEECTVSIARLRQHCTSETARTLRRQLGASTCAQAPDPTPVLWGKGVLSSSTSGNSPPRFEYKAIMEDDKESSPAASSSSSSSTSSSPCSSQTTASKLRGVMKSHGIALVRGVPTGSAATEALGLKLAGHIMGTMLGKTVWGISTEAVDSGALVNDSAYTTGGLPLHTDHSFVSEPPGLQVFSCLVPAPEGGESTYADGFAVAERLRKENPEAFEFFTKTLIKHQYLDEGYHLVSEGPIIQTDAFGVVVQFYKHHKSLIAITRDPSMVEHVLMEQGDTMIFNNHRAMHGRESYKGSRRMVGCYIGKDEANSEARLKGI